MQKIKLIVFALIVLIVIRVSGSEPTIEFSFRGPNNETFIRVNIDSIRDVMKMAQRPIGKLMPVLGTHDGQLKYVLSNEALRELLVDQRRDSILERFIKESAALMEEITDNCHLSDEQLAKISLAANIECVRMQKWMTRIEQSTIEAEELSADEFQRYCQQVCAINSAIALGPTREESLLISVCQSILNDEQKSKLRRIFVQPLVVILRHKCVTSDAAQEELLAQAVQQSPVDPFRLRDNYGEQYRTVMGLGEETLESILVPEQIVALKQLGKSDYRITLSLARQALTPASKQK